MKVGANQTISLMGKELLTVTEIISLKYKTIIFPTVSNPIFRDTYLYSDLFPIYKNVEVLDRETKVLKRITSNYYTVEELRRNYNTKNNQIINQAAKNMQSQFQQNIQKEIARVTKNIEPLHIENDVVCDNEVINDLRNKLFIEYDINISKNKDTYILLINKVINKIDIKKIEDYTTSNYSFGVSRNLNKGITKISIWDNSMEKKS